MVSGFGFATLYYISWCHQGQAIEVMAKLWLWIKLRILKFWNPERIYIYIYTQNRSFKRCHKIRWPPLGATRLRSRKAFQRENVWGNAGKAKVAFWTWWTSFRGMYHDAPDANLTQNLIEIHTAIMYILISCDYRDRNKLKNAHGQSHMCTNRVRQHPLGTRFAEKALKPYDNWDTAMCPRQLQLGLVLVGIGYPSKSGSNCPLFVLLAKKNLSGTCLAFYLASILTFYLASILAIYLASILTFYLAFWRVFGSRRPPRHPELAIWLGKKREWVAEGGTPLFNLETLTWQVGNSSSTPG